MASGPQWKTSSYSTVNGGSQKVADLSANTLYRLTSTVDAWFKVTDGAGSAASRTANNHLLVAGQEVLVYTGQDTTLDLNIIKDDAAANGHCSLSEVHGQP